MCCPHFWLLSPPTHLQKHVFLIEKQSKNLIWSPFLSFFTPYMGWRPEAQQHTDIPPMRAPSLFKEKASRSHTAPIAPTKHQLSQARMWWQLCVYVLHHLTHGECCCWGRVNRATSSHQIISASMCTILQSLLLYNTISILMFCSKLQKLFLVLLTKPKTKTIPSSPHTCAQSYSVQPTFLLRLVYKTFEHISLVLLFFALVVTTRSEVFLHFDI